MSILLSIEWYHDILNILHPRKTYSWISHISYQTKKLSSSEKAFVRAKLSKLFTLALKNVFTKLTWYGMRISKNSKYWSKIHKNLSRTLKFKADYHGIASNIEWTRPTDSNLYQRIGFFYCPVPLQTTHMFSPFFPSYNLRQENSSTNSLQQNFSQIWHGCTINY